MGFAESLGPFFRRLGWAIGLGGVGAVGTVAVYEYTDTVDMTRVLGDPTEFIYSPTAQVTTLWIHHTGCEECTIEGMDKYHRDKFGAGGISYQWMIDREAKAYYLSPFDVKKAHTKNQNTKGRSIVFKGDYEENDVHDPQLDRLENMLYSILSTFPHITKVRLHKDNPSSKTLCPGKHLTDALERRGLLFNNREQIARWLATMSKRLNNPCLDDDEPGFIDGEPC